MDMPFYAWASVIVNGRVVATDFAPDAGWLVATPGARPGGTLLVEDFGFRLPLTMTLPDGWILGSLPYGEVVRESVLDKDGNEVPGTERSGVLFSIFDDTSDGCGEPIGTPSGPGVVDLVRCLAGQPKIDISENKDVILDGYRGAYLEYEMAREHSWEPDDRHRQVWILDVDGVLLKIDAYSPAAASESVRAELREAVESIHFER
jgi:hypothetical protein